MQTRHYLWRMGVNSRWHQQAKGGPSILFLTEPSTRPLWMMIYGRKNLIPKFPTFWAIIKANLTTTSVPLQGQGTESRFQSVRVEIVISGIEDGALFVCNNHWWDKVGEETFIIDSFEVTPVIYERVECPEVPFSIISSNCGLDR